MYRKTLQFWSLGERRDVVLHVSSYEPSGRLSVEMLINGPFGLETCLPMTANVQSTVSLPRNAAYITSAAVSNDIMAFIRENSLGHELCSPDYDQFHKFIGFDMDKLYEFDPEGVTKFMLRQYRAR